MQWSGRFVAICAARGCSDGSRGFSGFLISREIERYSRPDSLTSSGHVTPGQVKCLFTPWPSTPRAKTATGWRLLSDLAAAARQKRAEEIKRAERATSYVPILRAALLAHADKYGVALTVDSAI